MRVLLYKHYSCQCCIPSTGRRQDCLAQAQVIPYQCVIFRQIFNSMKAIIHLNQSSSGSVHIIINWTVSQSHLLCSPIRETLAAE